MFEGAPFSEICMLFAVFSHEKGHVFRSRCSSKEQRRSSLESAMDSLPETALVAEAPLSPAGAVAVTSAEVLQADAAAPPPDPQQGRGPAVAAAAHRTWRAAAASARLAAPLPPWCCATWWAGRKA